MNYYNTNSIYKIHSSGAKDIRHKRVLMYLHLHKFKGRRHYSGVLEVEILVTLAEG